MSDKNLIIIRGVSSAGKTTFADFLCENMLGSIVRFQADDWMINTNSGEYEFKPEKLGFVHKSCQLGVENAMNLGTNTIVLSNTVTKERDFKIYLDLATKYGYRVTSLVCEKRHSGQQTHNIPEETLIRQEQNLRNSLKLR